MEIGGVDPSASKFTAATKAQLSNDSSFELCDEDDDTDSDDDILQHENIDGDLK